MTDNENKMKKMRRLLNDKYPNILTYGCYSHYVNLLEDTVTPKQKLKEIKNINKMFRNHQYLHSKLIEKKGVIPQLPNKTRWNSQADCLNTFIRNYKIYCEILLDLSMEGKANEGELDAFTRLQSSSLLKSAELLHKQLSVVSVVLDKVLFSYFHFKLMLN